MGSRGPVPKRSDQRRRRNADSKPDTVKVVGAVVQPGAPETLSPRAAAWYASLAESGQAAFYEPSDWQFALLVAEAMTEFAANPNAALLNSINAMMAKLLVSESDRRRSRMELERESAPQLSPVASLDAYRSG